VCVCACVCVAVCGARRQFRRPVSHVLAVCKWSSSDSALTPGWSHFPQRVLPDCDVAALVERCEALLDTDPGNVIRNMVCAAASCCGARQPAACLTQGSPGTHRPPKPSDSSSACSDARVLSS
jgi:hypothetical protein